MKRNRLIWGFIAVIVLITFTVSFGTMSGYSQKETSEQIEGPFGDLGKYPTAEYNALEPVNLAEREERRTKNKRYDKYLFVAKNPHPETAATLKSHGEPMPSALPTAESNLIIIGKIVSSKAWLSNDKSGVYSEYSVQIQNVLKNDQQKKLQTDEIITIDRAGGVVVYPNGQKVLYLNDWQRLPEINERYVLFLSKNESQNLNYKLLTGYKLKSNGVIALDNNPDFREYNEKSERDFINFILNGGKNNEENY